MIKVDPISLPVDYFINKEGEYIPFILNCPLKKKQFKGGPNKGQYYSSPGTCDFCQYKFTQTYQTKEMDGGSYELPYWKTVECNGHNAPASS